MFNNNDSDHSIVEENYCFIFCYDFVAIDILVHHYIISLLSLLGIYKIITLLRCIIVGNLLP